MLHHGWRALLQYCARKAVVWAAAVFVRLEKPQVSDRDQFYRGLESFVMSRLGGMEQRRILTLSSCLSLGRQEAMVPGSFVCQ